jgi:high-affinity nickel-transport protein
MLGFFFALGHSLVVMFNFIATIYMIRTIMSNLSQSQKYGDLISSSVSALFLLIIGLINLVLLIDICRALRCPRYEEIVLSDATLTGEIQGSWFACFFAFYSGVSATAGK